MAKITTNANSAKLPGANYNNFCTKYSNIIAYRPKCKTAVYITVTSSNTSKTAKIMKDGKVLVKL